MSINSTARRVTVHKGGGKPIRMFVPVSGSPGCGVDRSDECYDDPNGTDVLVPWEVWERVVETLKMVHNWDNPALQFHANPVSIFMIAGEHAHDILKEIGGEDGGDTDNKSTSIDHNGGAGR